MTPSGGRKTWVEETLYRQGQAKIINLIPEIVRKRSMSHSKSNVNRTGYGQL